MSDLIQQLNGEIATVVEGVRRAMVQVHVQGGGNGAGTIWHKDGLILTNAHVASQANLSVTLAGPEPVGMPWRSRSRDAQHTGITLKARLIARDVKRDLAALSVDASGLPVVSLGDSRALQPGEMVLALGHPWGILDSATAGVVVGVGADFMELSRRGGDWIVVSLPLRPGNSVGPLVDVRGRLVGINTMMMGPEEGVAVPLHVVERFLREALGSKVEALA